MAGVQHADIDHTGLTGVGDLSAHTGDTSDAHDASAISVLDTAANFTGTDVEAVLAELQDNIDGVGGGSFAGFPAIIVPQGLSISSASTPGAATTNNTAQIARTATVIIPSSMRLRSLWIHVTSNGSGSLLWGLYDGSSNIAACTELATGTAAPGGTGWREIAASGAPVVIPAGNYYLNVMNPAANASTISVNTFQGGSTSMVFRAWGTHTWDTTPDMTSASWTDSSLMYACFLEGELTSGGSRL